MDRVMNDGLSREPWEVREPSGAVNLGVYAADGAVVATVGGKHRTKSEKRENAFLIASAPALRRELARVIRELEAAGGDAAFPFLGELRGVLAESRPPK
jgi:hypothetical protein